MRFERVSCFSLLQQSLNNLTFVKSLKRPMKTERQADRQSDGQTDRQTGTSEVIQDALGLSERGLALLGRLLSQSFGSVGSSQQLICSLSDRKRKPDVSTRTDPRTV